MSTARTPIPLPRRAPVERLAFSPQEAADAMGVDRKTVYSWINAGQLRAFHAGRRTLIGREALMEFIAAREAEERGKAEELWR